MAVCILNRTEAKNYELHGTTPNCCNHPHYSHSLISEKVNEGTMRWVGPEGCPERRATEASDYVWVVKKSAGVGVWQMRASTA